MIMDLPLLAQVIFYEIDKDNCIITWLPMESNA